MSNVVEFPGGAESATAPLPAVAYAELAVTTNFSFLRGASHPEELARQAAALGLAGIGIADRNSVAGVVQAYAAVGQLNETIRALNETHRANAPELKLAVGARLTFADGTPDILAYPQNRSAWGRLTRLLTVGKSRGEKAECILFLDDLIEHIAGLNLIVMPSPSAHAREFEKMLTHLRSASPRHVWLGASMLYRGDDTRRLRRLAAIADTARVPLIAVNDVLYHAPERRPLQDVITCIREHVTIDTAGRLLEANAERHLKSGQEIARLFRPAPEAVDRSLRFLERCNFSLGELEKTEYPDENRLGHATPQEALVALANQGFARRYPEGAHPKVRLALERELEMTLKLNYAKYFLTVYDIVAFANSKGILCQGRGSAANSVICYCLGITEVDPERVDLLFERFVSEERKEPPDIDVDFEHDRREEVIQYIYNKYGRHHANLTATVIRYRGRSAIRQVGKAFGLSDDTVGALAGMLWGWSAQGVKEDEVRRAGLDPSDARLNQVMRLSDELIDFPRHLSQHPGGFLITRSRIDEVVPVENAAMDERTVIEWEKNDLETLRLLKVDVLALGMLSCLRRGLDYLRMHYRITPTLASLLRQEHADEEQRRPVYRMIQRADTIGTFQIESRAQMSMLPRLRPEKFYDLVIEVAIVRPGPIQGRMVHPYLLAREKFRDTGVEPAYPAPAPEYGPPDELKAILHKTMGVPLFQEQAMRIAIVAAKFEPAEADKLRRAMATFKRVGTIKFFHDKFINGMVVRGYDPAFAANCFRQISGFGEYGFPESHAASFANLVYVSCWMKCYYPDVFAAALLNSQPMGFYAPAQIVRDAREHGVDVRPIDVNHSDWDCTLEPLSPPVIPGRPGGLGPESITTNGGYGFRAPRFARPRNDGGEIHPRHTSMQPDIRTTHALRLGLRQISGFAEDQAQRIESVRGRGFDSVRDLWLRTRLPPSALERLANADAFGSLGLSRRDALWAVRALQRAGDKDDLPLFRRVAMPEMEPDVALPPMPPGEQVVEDYRHLHLSLKAHPVSFLRRDLDARGIVRHELLPAMRNGARVTVAGLVLVRQRPGTAKGVIFMTLEDETGIANTIVWQRMFETFRPIVIGARLVAVTGPLQSASGVIHVVMERIEDLTPLLRRLSDAHGAVDIRAHADQARRPIIERHRHPRAGDSLVTLLKDAPDLGELAAQTAEVMPKGRNFH
ncbi:MAG: error-prone DNA polymerase [Alphaproteobacteria bacterium]|nr:MAG: error-prone DNA polymerase [Alphaproteobacteria bacterium]